jgi:poly(A) polymerase/tRNA nucleotidyltransferase (CCA-adding enzyme)
MDMQQLEPTARELAGFFAARGVAAWLVGGAARDLARGQAPSDLDLAADGDGLALARALADQLGGAFVPLDDERETGRAVLTRSAPDLIIDIARLRAPTIEGDLALRDFSVNALAIPLTLAALDAVFTLGPSGLSVVSPQSPLFLDPTGGLADLRAGLLRVCGPASLRDDPLRTLRAARLAADLSLRPAPDLAAAMRDAAPGLAGVAAERVRDELLKLLDSPAAARWLAYLDECAVLTQIFPELEASRAYSPPGMFYRTILEHLLETVAALEWLVDGGRRAAGDAEGLPAALRAGRPIGRELPYADRYAALLEEPRSGGHRRAGLLKLAALLHDVAKPATAEAHPDGSVSFYGHQDVGAEMVAAIGRRLRLARADAAYLTLVVREHMRPGQLRTADVLTARAVARFFRDLGDAGPDVLLHELADHLATRGPQARADGWANHLAWVTTMLDAHWGAPPERFVPLLRGDDLMAELGLRPGPSLGALLRELAEAQAAGEIGTRAEAIALARHRLGAES